MSKETALPVRAVETFRGTVWQQGVIPQEQTTRWTGGHDLIKLIAQVTIGYFALLYRSIFV
ncbi:hypothetical protein [Paenibacillus taichungensis]|uniref:hypothetical protein n=1 Tax=Paenibacillus taichungensis TaxID=484184 RepID=UPI0011815D93|nr:hypothetical protein [Paenibacillus taichungensis]